MTALKRFLISCILAGLPLASPAATVSGALQKWQLVTIDVTGPNATETGTSPNPFLDIRLDVTLTGPQGQRYVVPGFFAGDGNGGSDGTVWRARFTPDATGAWNYTVSLLQGDAIAVADQLNSGTATGEHAASGTFTISDTDGSTTGFAAGGRLDYVGRHYLKQVDGDYWIKSGIDSPENFFAYAGFDGTIDQPGGVTGGALVNGIHRYAPHVQDWNSGDPDFLNTATGVDGKGIIGAINYLSAKGVNSIYIMTNNLGGDGRDVYPFIGASGSNFDNTHYDVSKLAQWNTVLQHMQNKGIAAHLILGEQEIDNTNWLDNGALGTERKLYYRELVARFAWLNAVKWNISEESRYSSDQHNAFAQTIRDLDWAQHPIGVHTWVNNPDRTYDDLLGNNLFSISSIQFHEENASTFVEEWRKKTADAGWPWVIDMDEVGPANIGLSPDNADELRKSVLYPVYFSGGNVEWYFGYQGADIRTEDFRRYEEMFDYMRHAREFLQALPFQDMTPMDELLVDAGPGDQVFAHADGIYAVYLQSLTAGASLTLDQAEYAVQWFNPRNGSFVTDAETTTTDSLPLATAQIANGPEAMEDWVVLVRRQLPEQPAPANPENPTDTTDTTDTSNATDESAPDVSAAMPTEMSSGGATGICWLLLVGVVVIVRRSSVATSDCEVKPSTTEVN